MNRTRTLVVAAIVGACAACQLVLGIESRDVLVDGGTGSDAAADATPDGTVEASACGTKTACGSVCVDLASDKDNCGACGRSCLGEACTGGRCPTKTLFPNIQNPNALATDGTYLYVSFQTGVYMLNKTGGLIRTLAPAGLSIDVKAANGNVYATNSTSNLRRVVRAPNDGGTSNVIYGTDGGQFFEHIAVNGQKVVWSSGRAGLWSANDDGTGLVPLQPESLDGGLLAIDMDDASVYFADLIQSTIATVPIGGGQVTQIGSAINPTTLLLGPDGKLYYGDGSRVRRISTDGGTVEILASALDVVGGIAIGGGRVYYSSEGLSAGTGEIFSRSLGGNDPLSLAAGENFPTELVVDDQYVYWIAESSTVGNLRRTPR